MPLKPSSVSDWSYDIVLVLQMCSPIMARLSRPAKAPWLHQVNVSFIHLHAHAPGSYSSGYISDTYKVYPTSCISLIHYPNISKLIIRLISCFCHAEARHTVGQIPNAIALAPNLPIPLKYTFCKDPESATIFPSDWARMWLSPPSPTFRASGKCKEYQHSGLWARLRRRKGCLADHRDR